MLDEYSESRRKRATWRVMFELDEMLNVSFAGGVKGRRFYKHDRPRVFDGIYRRARYSLPRATFRAPLLHRPQGRHCPPRLSHKTSCHPSPQKQIGTPAQLREPTRTPLLHSRPVTGSPRKTPEGAKREEGGENAVIFLWGSRATGAPLSP